MKNNFYKRNRIKLWIIILIPITLLFIKISELNPYLVEGLYSNGINKYTIILLSRITGLLPFSLGEIIFYVAIIFVLVNIFILCFKLLKRNKGKTVTILFDFIIYSMAIVSIVYFLFIFLWGINYNRPPLVSLLELEQEKHSTEDLVVLCDELIREANILSDKQTKDSRGVTFIEGNFKDIANRADLGYETIASEYTFLSGKYGKPKGVLLSEKMCYTGITGVYFPFTAEANVNTFIPDFMIPATTTHEMAHQRGIAREDEANFCAYLACVNHPDEDFQYSGNILALIYSFNALRRDNPTVYKGVVAKINENVRVDLNYLSNFWDEYEGKIDEISDNINDSYLKSNGQEDGVKSYSRMVELLLDYSKGR